MSAPTDPAGESVALEALLLARARVRAVPQAVRRGSGRGGASAQPAGVRKVTRMGVAPAATPTEDKPVLALKVGDRVKHATLGAGTVSYTHLTLPTKLEV